MLGMLEFQLLKIVINILIILVIFGFAFLFTKQAEYVESLKNNAVTLDERGRYLLKRMAYGTGVAIITILIEYALVYYLSGYFEMDIDQFGFIFSIFVLCFFLVMGVGPQEYTEPTTSNYWVRQDVYWTLSNKEFDISGKPFLIGALSFFLINLIYFIV